MQDKKELALVPGAHRDDVYFQYTTVRIYFLPPFFQITHVLLDCIKDGMDDVAVYAHRSFDWL